jgi:hypothetical protein
MICLFLTGCRQMPPAGGLSTSPVSGTAVAADGASPEPVAARSTRRAQPTQDPDTTGAKLDSARKEATADAAPWTAPDWCTADGRQLETPLGANAGDSSSELSVEWHADGQQWRWTEGTGEAVAVPASQQEIAFADCPSKPCRVTPDGRYRAWSRPAGEHQDEILFEDLSQAPPVAPRVVASMSSQPVWERHAETIANGISMTVSVRLWWMEGLSPRLAYTYETEFDAIGEDPYEAVRLFEPDTAREYQVLPGSEVWSYVISGSGETVLAVTETEARLIRVDDGGIIAAIPLGLANTAYWQPVRLSPDGGRALIFIEDGLAEVDMSSGRFRLIPLSYTPIGMGHGALMPEIIWQPDGSALVLVLQGGSYREDDSRTSVWRINAKSDTPTRLYTVDGSYLYGGLSSDGRFLATTTQIVNKRRIFLTDMQTGEQRKYVAGFQLDCCHWSPSGHQFLYSKPGDDGRGYLGQVCIPERQLPDHGRYRELVWLADGRRFVAVIDTSSQPYFDYRSPIRWEIRLMTVDGKDRLLADGYKIERPWIERPPLRERY